MEEILLLLLWPLLLLMIRIMFMTMALDHAEVTLGQKQDVEEEDELL